MRKKFITTILILLILISFLNAKILLKDKNLKKSNSLYHIRVDGLACYFCSYGLERFFKKTGKIYSMDINLKSGIVTIRFVKGKKLPSAKDIYKYVHDAGFTPRWIEVKLKGRFSANEKSFIISENKQSLDIELNIKDREKTDAIVSIKGKLNKKNILTIEKVNKK